METRLWLLLCLLVAVASGCVSGIERYNAGQPKDGVLIAAFDAKKRAIIHLKTGTDPATGKGGKMYVCPEPPPDVATELSKEFNAALQAAYQGFKGDLTVARSVAETFKQISPTSEATTFLRSSLSQLCWISINRDFSVDQTQKAMELIVSASRGLAFREVAVQLVKQMESIPNDPQSAALKTSFIEAIKVILVQSSQNPREVSEAVMQLAK